jgi:cation transport regulator ChaC
MGRKVVAATRPGRQAALQVGQSVVGTLVVVSEAAQTTSRLARTEVEDAEVELQVARRVEMEVVGGAEVELQVAVWVVDL